MVQNNMLPAISEAEKSSSNARKASNGRKSAVRWMVVLLIVLAAGGAAVWYFYVRPAQAAVLAQAQTVSNTVTYTVQRGSIQISASGEGRLAASQSVNMSFSTGGKVAELRVKLGDMVKEGDVLARLEQAPALEASLATAQASLLEAEQSLEALQKNAGSTLAQAYQAQTAAQAAYDEALKTSRRAELGRCSPEITAKYTAALNGAAQKLAELTQKQPGSESQTIARYDYDTAFANYTYCLSHTASEKTSASAALEVAKVTFQQAQENYDALKKASGVDPDALAKQETRVETARTRVQAAQEALDGITLVAPISGKITSLTANQGAIVDTSTFLTISDVSKAIVSVSVDETDMGTLQAGNAAQVTFTALSGQAFHGTVTLASPQMVAFGPFRAASGEVTLDEAASKTLQSLPLGLSATVTITGKSANNVLLVPAEALKQDSSGAYTVTLVGSDGLAVKQPVTVGLTDGTNTEITGGLKEGDVIRYTGSSLSIGTGNSFEGMPGGEMEPPR